ncbi:GNAT family N-acetyltransferase [Stackebrandtia soli]|uniref:GNAT family N-acetyltransferase n=1 Tax=Stackebrandtia soli TaxID=1892856 RepID=UPI0039ECE84C
MTTDQLMARARRLWEELATTQVRFVPGRVNIAVAPDSKLSPAGWIGVVALGDAAIVTVRSERAERLVRKHLGTTPVGAVIDATVIQRLLPVMNVLGPATLAYADESGFRTSATGTSPVEQLASDHPDLAHPEALAGEADAAEAGLTACDSPVFAIRADDLIVAAAGYHTWPRRTAHIGVLTAPHWRNKGLAKAVGAAATAHALANGFLPQWRARVLPSQRAARTLGFRTLGTQLSFELTDP